MAGVCTKPEHGNTMVEEASACEESPLEGGSLQANPAYRRGARAGDMLMALRYLPSLAAQARARCFMFAGGGTCWGEAEHEAEPEPTRHATRPIYPGELMDLPVLVGRESPHFTEQVPYLNDRTLLCPENGQIGFQSHRFESASSGRVIPIMATISGVPTELADWLSCLPCPRCGLGTAAKGRAAAEVVWANGHQNVHDLGPEINTLADTAAILSHLDLLVSVDTSPAHLAGVGWGCRYRCCF